MSQTDDISKRIIQDGQGNKRFLRAVLIKLIITVLVLLGASALWMWYNAQACITFYKGEADMNEGRFAAAKEKGKKASQQMELALQFNKVVLGESHAEVANDTLNLARCYDMCGEWEKAKGLHEKACSLFEKSKGPEDSEFAWSLVSFGDHYRYGKDFKKAIEYYNKALPVIEKKHGTGSKEYKWTMQRIELAEKEK